MNFYPILNFANLHDSQLILMDLLAATWNYIIVSGFDFFLKTVVFYIESESLEQGWKCDKDAVPEGFLNDKSYSQQYKKNWKIEADGRNFNVFPFVKYLNIFESKLELQLLDLLSH